MFSTTRQAPHAAVRSVPWLLALLGLAIPLVGTGFVVWQIVAIWLACLDLTWLAIEFLDRPREPATPTI